MSTDKLPNSTQMADVVTALQTIAVKSNTPYNASNKLPTDYADDTNQNHKFATSAQLQQIATNQNNILLTYNQNGKTFNLFDINRPIDVTYHASGVVSDNAITVTPSGDWAYVGIKIPNVPAGSYRISGKIANLVTGGTGSTRIVVSQYSSASQGSLTYVNVTTNGDFSGNFSWSGGDIYVLFYVNNTAASSAGYTYTASEIQVIDNTIYSAGFTDYQPYSLPNTVITPALVECVDNGVKNRVYVDNSGTFTASGSSRSYDIPVTATGNIAISFGSLTSTDTDTNSCAIVFLNSSNVGFLTISMNRGSNVSQTVTLTDTAVKIRIYPANSYNESADDTVTWNNLMICDESLWKVSQKYVFNGYLTPTASSTITIRNGGYYKLNNSCTVCMRINLSEALSSGAVLFSDLPIPISNSALASGTAIIYVSNDSGVPISITNNGEMKAYDSIPVGAYQINCTYLCK